jgi:hypothetical protein
MIACYIYAHVVSEYFGNERNVKLPAGTENVYNSTVVAGVVLVPGVGQARQLHYDATSPKNCYG